MCCLLLQMLYIFFVTHNVGSEKILCIFPFPSYSHQQIFQPIWKELSMRGHQVTVISPNILADSTLTNLTEIDVSFTYNILHSSDFQNQGSHGKSVLNKLLYIYHLGLDIIEAEFQLDTVQEVIDDINLKFDVIIFQYWYIFNPVLGFVAKFKGPLVAISSMGVFLHSHDALGNPTHPIISPDIMLNLPAKFSFFDKVKSFWFNIWYRALYYWYALPKSDRLARKYFGEDMPYLGDIEKNIDLMMITANPLIHTVRANVPNVIEINQMHIRGKKPLPQELKAYLDNSPQGVIYFSLGSNIKSANLGPRRIEEIVACLGELPYNVLWKWETDYLPGKPDNVMTRKWLPQQDVLGHPNVKVFVTQGGLQSIEEAIYNEVPMVGMPFIADQPSNLIKVVERGMGLAVDYRTFTKNELKGAIIEVAENIKYKQEVKKGRYILMDQPMKGVDKAVWWIEYVIRHKGAKHLRSPAADMSFFEYLMLDVILFLLVCISLGVWTILKVIFIVKNSTRQHVQKLKKN